MKEIKVFVGSSITEFHKVRMKMMVVFQQVNQILKKLEIDSKVLLEMCEFEAYVIKDKGTQEYINKRILDSEMAFFMFNQVFGTFTKEELIFTHNNLASKDHPIKVFKAFTCSDEVTNHLTSLTNIFKFIDITTFDDPSNLLFSMLKMINDTYLNLELKKLDGVVYLNHSRIYT